MSYLAQEASCKVIIVVSKKILILITGHVILELKRAIDISKVGITFEGTTKPVAESSTETQLFSVQEILWNAAPSKGKAPAKNRFKDIDESSTSRKVLLPTSGVGHTFLFAIKWPMVNFPPSLPPQRSLVQTQYVLRAFLQVSNSDEEINSEPLYVDFCPHVDPSVALKQIPDTTENRHTIVKDNNDRILGEASLLCTSDRGAIFGSDCPLSLVLLIRQPESKYLPRKAKVEVCEIHKCIGGQPRKHCFILSSETFQFPSELLKPHQECTIPLRVQIPVPEDDSRRSATGLPTLCIGGLQVEYLVRVSIPLQYSRFKPSAMTKAIVVDCPIVVGNVKPKDPASTRSVPRLVVNAEGEGTWDSQSTKSKDQYHGRKNIVEWSELCEIPRFLAGGDVDEYDIM
jgi:hypothetical protein